MPPKEVINDVGSELAGAICTKYCTVDPGRAGSEAADGIVLQMMGMEMGNRALNLIQPPAYPRLLLQAGQQYCQ